MIDLDTKFDGQTEAATRAEHRAVRLASWGVTALAACATWWAAAAYGMSFARLVLIGDHDVELGFADAIVADAAAWRFADRPLYGTLAEGYAGPPYAPGMPLLVGALMGMRLWNGWPLLITYAAGLALIALARTTPTTATARRRVTALTVALAPLHLVTLPLLVPLSLLHEGRADLVSWVLALLAVVAADRAADRATASSGRWAMAGGVAAGLAFAFKQTAGIAVVAVVVAGLWRRGRALRQLLPFLAGAGAVGAIVVGGIALNSGEVGMRAMFIDGPAFDRVMGWAPAVVALIVVAGPPAVAWALSQWIVRRAVGADTWRADLQGHAAVVSLAVVGTPAAAAMLRFDGADSNQLIGIALAWTWSMARTARTAAAHATHPGAAASVVCLIGLATFVSPAWQRPAQSGLPGFARTAPSATLAVFRPISPHATTALARFAQPDAIAMVCGEGAAGQADASFYDPRRPYRDAVRTGRIAPGIVGLVDGYAIGQGPATPLLAAIRAQSFACIVEPELLDQPGWLDYVGARHAPAFAEIGDALRSSYAPSEREFEGREVWLPRNEERRQDISFWRPTGGRFPLAFLDNIR